MLGFYNYTVWLTYLSLASASCGIYFAANGNPFIAIICLLVSGFCDMFDGKVARTKERTNSEQNFGIQIDSLSDLVCFGVLPAVIGYSVGMSEPYFIPVFCLFIICGMIRLAYFNVTEMERTSNETGTRKQFQGLPITSSAMVFPLLYCFKKLLCNSFYIVYASLMILVAVLFISKIHVRKPGNKALFGMAFIGLIILIILIIGRVL